jgi:multicomponent Na+:H+ antiporter subunit A
MSKKTGGFFPAPLPRALPAKSHPAMEVFGAVLSGFLLGFAAPLIHKRAPRASGWLLAILPFWLGLYFASRVAAVASGETARYSIAWAPSVGAALSFYVDGLSLLFALLISTVGALVLVYSGAYLAGHPQQGRFYLFVLAFMASMLGVVLSDNLFLLYVFWELTTLSSYLLIGFDHTRESARAAALQALLVTVAGGLALLSGLVLLAQAAGSAELSEIATRGEALRSHPLYLPILGLVLAGALTKSAQFPFHFWLPNAMEAPTPVSAYLHSATMVKAGVYLLARLHPALSGTDAWFYAVAGAGSITMLLGAWLALHEHDFKRILAYSTVSALGILVMLLGFGQATAVKAAVVFLLAHALYKGALFLTAGAVDHAAGSRDVREVAGLYRAMPVTASAALLAAASMAGLPPLLGFIGKEAVYEAAQEASPAGLAWTVASVAAGVLFFALALIVGVRPFVGRPLARQTPHEAPPALWLGPLGLALAGAIAGIFPRPLATLLAPAAAAILGEPVALELALWHGWNPTIALSVATLAAGAACFAARDPLLRLSARLRLASRPGPESWYRLSLQLLDRAARGQTRILQSGHLSYYLSTVIAVIVAALALPLLGASGIAIRPLELRPFELALAALILAATLAAAGARSRLGAVAALGVAGYGIALIFALFGAPDLAMTQFLFETFMVILFVLVFYFLPAFQTLSPPAARLRDALLATAAGALIAGLVLAASTVQLHEPISSYFVEHSVPLAHGRNVVNVILVDFRALDTLGEITVLALAAVGVLALLKLLPSKETRA